MTIANNDPVRTEEAVRAQVREILLDLAPVKDRYPDGKTDLELEADLGYNSLALLEAIVAMEDELGIVLTNDGSVAAIRTVADIENFVVGVIQHGDD